MTDKRFVLPESCIGPVDWINEEHQALLDSLKRAAEAAAGGRVADVDSIFQDMMEGMQDHFRHEEKLMAETRFPGLEWHKAHHAQTLTRAHQTIERCRARGYADGFDVDRMFDQFVLDMSRADGKFYEYLISTGQADKLPVV